MQDLLARYINWENLVTDARAFCEENYEDGITNENVSDVMQGYIEDLVEALDVDGYEEVGKVLAKASEPTHETDVTVKISLATLNELRTGAGNEHISVEEYAASIVTGYVGMDLDAQAEVMFGEAEESSPLTPLAQASIVQPTNGYMIALRLNQHTSELLTKAAAMDADHPSIQEYAASLLEATLPHEIDAMSAPDPDTFKK